MSGNKKPRTSVLGRLTGALSALVLVIALLGFVPSQAQAVSYYLPYPTGYTATVSQGPGGSTSHNTSGTYYAYDFVLGGREVWASAPGTVVGMQTNVTGQTGPNSQAGAASSGNYVMLQHADGSCTRYQHMAHGSISVSMGQSVTQGQKLGVEGNTGYTLPVGRGYHLHFERDNCGSGNSMPIDFVENNWTSQNVRNSDPGALGGSSGKAGLAAARNADGRIELLAIGTDNKIYATAQLAPSSNSWKSWYLVPSGARSVATTTTADGRIQVFYVGNDGAVWYRYQTTPNGGWSGEYRIAANLL